MRRNMDVSCFLKKIGVLKIVVLGILVTVGIPAFSEPASTHNDMDVGNPLTKENAGIGLFVGFGGRYDDLRMCVGSPANVKGGPIAEFIGFRLFVRPNALFSMDMNIPIGRTLLFAGAFKMLQWEPDMTCSFYIPLKDPVNEFVVAPSIGLAFHYGPDYTTDKEDTNKISFFALGPKLSVFTGFHRFITKDGNLGTSSWQLGVRIFYEHFRAEDDEQPITMGNTVGAMLEAVWIWYLFN